MPNVKTKAQLQAELEEANERIEELAAKLEEIVSIADAEDDEEEDDSLEGEDPDDLTETGPAVPAGMAQGS